MKNEKILSNAELLNITGGADFVNISDLQGEKNTISIRRPVLAYGFRPKNLA